MNNKQYVLLILFLISSCSSTKEIFEKNYEKKLSWGQKLSVKKTEEVTERVGNITGFNYGKVHRFKYEVSIAPTKIKWKGSYGETPRTIAHKGKILLLSSTSKKRVYDHPDTTNERRSSETVIVTSYYKHVDKRVFFKKIGKQYWLTISDSTYNFHRKNGAEEVIPSEWIK